MTIRVTEVPGAVGGAARSHGMEVPRAAGGVAGSCGTEVLVAVGRTPIMASLAPISPATLLHLSQVAFNSLYMELSARP